MPRINAQRTAAMRRWIAASGCAAAGVRCMKLRQNGAAPAFWAIGFGHNGAS